ncbi:MAG: MBL fold metallo-hydrolase [Oscillospiraceae bacterium]|jgi:L-ascorbate metabolism protein UlaG (beta-lactamase superfamily)|nr:MBL fold metallo-hydrolase [Oscillospiraceae bacterium]
MKITWLGHSCFILESGGFRALLDPYHEVPGLPDTEAEADAVYCSHDHFDHGYTEKVRLTSGRENPFSVTEVQTFHDGKGGTLRGSNVIRKFTAGGVSVAHFGDLGHPLSPEQLAELGGCDAILIPVGGFYTIDAAGAKAAADAVGASVVVPMHYRDGAVGFDVLSTLDSFTGLYPPEQVKRYGSSLTIEKGMEKQVAVLTAAGR